MLKNKICLILSTIFLISNMNIILYANDFNGFGLSEFNNYLNNNMNDMSNGLGIETEMNDISIDSTQDMFVSNIDNFEFMDSFMNNAMDNTISFFDSSDLVASGMIDSFEITTVEYLQDSNNENVQENTDFADMQNPVLIEENNSFINEYENLNDIGNLFSSEIDGMIQTDNFDGQAILEMVNQNQFEQFQDININQLSFIEDLHENITSANQLDLSEDINTDTGMNNNIELPKVESNDNNTNMLQEENSSALKTVDLPKTTIK